MLPMSDVPYLSSLLKIWKALTLAKTGFAERLHLLCGRKWIEETAGSSCQASHFFFVQMKDSPTHDSQTCELETIDSPTKMRRTVFQHHQPRLHRTSTKQKNCLRFQHVILLLVSFALASCWRVSYTLFLQSNRIDDTTTTTTPSHDSFLFTTGATQTNGPPPFCESDLTFYRTTFWNALCKEGSSKRNRANNFDVIETPRIDNILFLHIPKTGGESLERTLHVPKNHNLQRDRRTQYSDTTFVLTVLRNPFARTFSWFRFCLHGWRGRLPKPWNHCALAHEILQSEQQKQPSTTTTPENHELTVARNAFSSWVTTVFGNETFVDHRITVSMVDFLGGLVPSLQVDYYLRMEHYAEDFSRIKGLLGLGDLPHANDSSGRQDSGSKISILLNTNYTAVTGDVWQRPYQEIYTVSSRQIVALHFAKDLVAFGYSF